MITFESFIETARQDHIRALDVSAFSEDDVINLILQRSEIIRDQRTPARIIRAWGERNEAPIRTLANRMGDELVRRALAIIWLEYQELKPTLQTLAPTSVADIGCGYAMFDLFLWQDHPGRLVLIDIEESDGRDFGFKATGSGYSSLDVARRFLTANGVAEDQITCCNPKQRDVLTLDPVDVAFSLVSCGFHYPVETYTHFFKENVTKAVILDLRKSRAKSGTESLASLGKVSLLTEAANGGAKRMLMRKPG